MKAVAAGQMARLPARRWLRESYKTNYPRVITSSPGHAVSQGNIYSLVWSSCFSELVITETERAVTN